MKRSTLTILLLLIFLVLIAALVFINLQRNTSRSENNQPNQNVAPTSVSNATVYFVDVGQGDSELIKTQDDKTILIDTGPSSAQSQEISFLSSHTSGVIDDMVLTHPDSDHIGNAASVLHSFVVKAIYHSGYNSGTQTYNNFIAAAKAEGCPIYTNSQVHAGDYMNWSSSVTFRIMSINSHASSSNDASIVIKLTDSTVDFLFEGDASSTVEQQMISQFGSALDVEILKVGHHGSSSSTSDAFLTATSPAIGLIEVGAGNTYGHPTQACLDRLSTHQVTVYRTDLSGTVTITTNGSSWSVNTQK